MPGLGLSIPDLANARGQSLDPATLALVQRMSGPPGATRAALIDTLVRAIKAAGIWSKLHCLYLLAAHDAQAARLNWAATGYALTAAGTVTFTADRGYAGDGSSGYLDTGWAPNLGLQDSLCLGVWSRSSAQEAAPALGLGTTTGITITPRSSADTMVTRVNTATGLNATSTDGSGWFTANRSGASAVQAYRNGAPIASGTTASSAPSSATVCLMRYANALYAARPLGAAAIAASLDATEQAALYAALLAYLTAVGAA